MCSLTVQKFIHEAMKPKKFAPRPITSFLEDEVDPGALKREMQKALRSGEAERNKARSRTRKIFVIRLILPLLAVALAMWLYTLVDNFISHRQRLQLRAEHGLLANEIICKYHQNSGEDFAIEAREI